MNYYSDLIKAAIDISKKNERCIVGLFRFDENQKIFQGHFPGNPILPGVFQLEMIKFCIEALFKVSLNIRKVNRTKFSRPILPGMSVMVEIMIDDEKNGFLNVKAVVKIEEGIAGRANLTFKKLAQI